MAAGRHLGFGHLNDPQRSNANCMDNTVICSLRWYNAGRQYLKVQIAVRCGDYVQPQIVINGSEILADVPDTLNTLMKST